MGAAPAHLAFLAALLALGLLFFHDALRPGRVLYPFDVLRAVPPDRRLPPPMAG